jgi:predicted HAD superfamily phosphohydrolase YqeG
MTDLSLAYETYRARITPEDSHFVEGCTPDLHVADLLDITYEKLSVLGVAHVLIDRDGTMACWPQPPIASNTLRHLRSLAAHPDLLSFSIATDNMSPQIIEEARSIGEQVRVFQPVMDDITDKITGRKTNPDFYPEALRKLGVNNAPDTAVMIGDSPCYDIVPAQLHGLKTILVDRLEKANFQGRH